MDPDIPAPSIEEESLPHRDKQNARPPFASPAIKVNHHNPIHQNNAAAVPLPPSSPMRTPYRSPSASNLKTKSSSPRTPSRSPSVASSYRDDKRQSTPVLVSKRSTSSLSAARGTTPAFRRASSNLNPASPVPYGKMAVPHEKPQLTPSSVAKEYFGKELEAHASLQSPLAVIVHDACYGHRFSRPRTTKNALATIVERPERIHATLLGASTAYVRLGGRHAEGQHAPRPKHNPQHVREIPFQIRKTSRNLPLTHPSVAFVHGSKWMEELQIMCDTTEGKLAMNGKELARPIGYGKDENGSPLPKLHEGDLYLCRESLAAFQGCLGGVCDAVDTVFSSDTTRRAFVCIRPPGHHCSSNFPSGFCWLNNVHVGIAYAAMTHGLTHAAIIDFDLHHGDGSQNIAWAQNRKAHTAAKNAASHKKIPIGYYSLHDINSYPCEWGDEEKVQKASLCIENAHGQSIWNVHLEPWNSLEEFWQLYETKYTILLDKARIFLRHHTARLRAAGNQSPRAAIFISAGFDASEWEGAGMQRHSVNVPTEFYARFTADIVKLAHEENLGVDDRVISVLEGGYSDRALTSGVLSHICGFSGNREGAANGHGLSVAGDNKFQTINNWIAESVSNSYLPDWWALQNLEELEAVVAGRQPPTAKSLKDKTGNYSSPTQASTLKMTDHARERHSLSALQARLGSESEYTPPPPDVDWAVASYELSRIIIPGDRQTQSCTHEELNAEAARARRERQSTVGVPAGPDERMQLRDRKAKLPPPPPIPSTRVASRNEHRRTTIAAISDLPDPSMQGVESAMTRPRRRSSDASSILSSFQNMKLSEAGGADTTAPANHVTSSRAGSVMTEKSTKAVAIKKTRAPVTTKTTAKLKSSPRKPKAMPPPDGSVNGGALSSKPSVIDEKKVLGGGEKRDFSNPSRSGSADEVDSLTNGVKKISIKLNMTTAEKNAAKEQHRAADEKQKKPRAPRKSAVPKTTKLTKLNSSTAPGNTAPVEAQTIKTEKTTNQPMLIPPAFVDPNSQGFALPSASPVEPNPNHSVSDPSASQPPSSWPQSNNPPDLQQTFEIANVPPQEKTMAPPGQAIVVPVGPVQQTSNAPKPFEHFQIAREQPPAPVYQMMQTSAEANPPRPTSAGLSTPRHTKQDLPVFTSSSPIPFAVPPNARVDDITMEEPKDG